LPLTQSVVLKLGAALFPLAGRGRNNKCRNREDTSTIRGDAATAAALKNVPIMVLHGDNVDKSPMFSTQLVNNRKMAELAKTAGGSIEIVSLPDLGIKGNSHFPMMEKNNAEVADVIHKWLAGKGLVD
jgi:pimeloyl-ACP methyl ester carboxylesterase